jgi:hypothetical protein
MNEEWNKPLLEKIEILSEIKDIHTLRKLFVDELNYDYTDSEPGINYPEGIKENIISTRIISEKGDFKIVFCTIEKLLKGTELPAVKSISGYYPLSNLIVFTNKENKEFHFVNTRYVGKVEERKAKGFRRITIGKTDRLRTAAERLSKIYAPAGISPSDLMVRCEEAFDVEIVTKAFYNEFVIQYKNFRKFIQKEHKISKDYADSLTQEIFNRLIFLYFIQKKLWLNGDYKFLYNNYKEYNAKKKEYYKGFLIPLFKKLSIKDFPHPDFKFRDIEESFSIPNTAFEPVFEDLLERFNFTIREDSEFEEEVAIDPEMLGKIFENLILTLESIKFTDIPEPGKKSDARKKSGSYYTPRFVVSFMVRQSLLNYLTNELPEIPKEKLKSLIFCPPDKRDIIIDEIAKPQEIKEKLLNLRIVDPGVGSGAFSVDILNKLVYLIEILNKKMGESESKFNLRKKLIEECIYGVDIQERAVHLAQLRLWLWLCF